MNSLDTITWEVVKVRVGDLRPLSSNPRFITKEDAKQLERSLEKFGQAVPIVINQDNTIIGGHQRVKIINNPDMTINAMRPDRQLDLEEVKELNIRLNKNQGQWDFDKLANEWELEDLLDWGFSEFELGIDGFGVEPEEDPLDDGEGLELRRNIFCPKCGFEFTIEDET